MEFLLFLTPIGNEIYSLVSQKIRVVENSPVCKEYPVMGYYSSEKNLFTMCTDTIKNFDGENMEYWVNETFYHESVHVAQDCKASAKGAKVWFEHLGIDPDNMQLNERRKEDLERSNKIFPQNTKIEHEAYWMEDKPEKVKYFVSKYCF